MSDDFQGAPPAPPAPPMAAPVGDGSGPASDNNKMLAVVGWVIWPVALFALLMEPYKNDKWLKSHALQALALHLIITVIAFLWPFGMIYAIILALKANNGESLEVPVIYGLVKQYI